MSVAQNRNEKEKKKKTKKKINDHLNGAILLKEQRKPLSVSASVSRFFFISVPVSVT